MLPYKRGINSFHEFRIKCSLILTYICLFYSHSHKKIVNQFESLMIYIWNWSDQAVNPQYPQQCPPPLQTREKVQNREPSSQTISTENVDIVDQNNLL